MGQSYGIRIVEPDLLVAIEWMWTGGAVLTSGFQPACEVASLVEV